MSLDRVRALMAKQLERGCTLHEEKAAFSVAARIIRREGLWSYVRADWPTWYDEDGNLKTNHEELRREKADKAKAKAQEDVGVWFAGHWFKNAQDYADWLRRTSAEAARRRAQEEAEAERRAREEAAWWERARREAEERAKKSQAYIRAERAVNARPGTIGHYANIILREVVRESQYGTKWGHSYYECIQLIKAKFPGSNPTIHTLRWYESKLRTIYGKDAVPRRVNDTE